MPTRVTRWQCNICKELYPGKQAASWCEGRHGPDYLKRQCKNCKDRAEVDDRGGAQNCHGCWNDMKTGMTNWQDPNT